MTSRKGFLQWSGTPLAILQELISKGGRMQRRDMVSAARRLAGTEHAGNVALLRLQEAGLVELRFELTEAGREKVQKARLP